MKFKKKSSLKLLSQSQPNFAEMILRKMGNQIYFKIAGRVDLDIPHIFAI
jgi:hypothetical protein